MRSTKFLIIGNGRLATHLAYYFSLLNLSFLKINRDITEDLCTHLKYSNRILVLIRDDEIIDFVEKNKKYTGDDAIWIHCSGLVKTPLAESAHPLASFSERLFEESFYRKIPFAIEKGKIFPELLPGLPNPSFEIENVDREMYHTMCVLAGNFSTLLWNEFEKYMIGELKLPRNYLIPYLKSVYNNIEYAGDSRTGPFQRGDVSTIKKHMEALNNKPIKKIYESFVEVFLNRKIKL